MPCTSVLLDHTRSHRKCIKLSKSQALQITEVARIRIQNVVVNVAIVVFSTSISYSKIFQVYTMRMDFCSNQRNQRYISSESASNAAFAIVGMMKTCYRLEFWFYLKSKQITEKFLTIKKNILKVNLMNIFVFLCELFFCKHKSVRHPLTLQDLPKPTLLRTPISWNHLPMRVKVLVIQLMFIS